MTEKKIRRSAFKGWEGGGERPLNRTHPYTQQKIKEGKTDKYEVTRIKESETGGRQDREYVGYFKTLPEARKLARKVVLQPGTKASEIFRWYLHNVYADSSHTKLMPQRSYYHIETWEVHNGKIVIEEY
jgi:hypothetical protein